MLIYHHLVVLAQNNKVISHINFIKITQNIIITLLHLLPLNQFKFNLNIIKRLKKLSYAFSLNLLKIASETSSKNDSLKLLKIASETSFKNDSLKLSKIASEIIF